MYLMSITHTPRVYESMLPVIQNEYGSTSVSNSFCLLPKGKHWSIASTVLKVHLQKWWREFHGYLASSSNRTFIDGGSLSKCEVYLFTNFTRDWLDEYIDSDNTNPFFVYLAYTFLKLNELCKCIKNIKINQN